MKLFGSERSRSFRAVWALEEAHLDYEYVAVSFGSKDENGSYSEGYRHLNAQGKVPTLVDQDLVVTESAAILNYIARKKPKANLMPATVELKARYDEISFFVLSELEQSLWTYAKHSFALPESMRVPEVKDTTKLEFKTTIKALQQLFDGEGFVVGDQFTMADILLAHTLAWAEKAKFEVPDELIAYRKRMYGREACLKAIEKDASFSK